MHHAKSLLTKCKFTLFALVVLLLPMFANTVQAITMQNAKATPGEGQVIVTDLTVNKTEVAYGGTVDVTGYI